MQFWESVAVALSSLKAHKLRSILTLVGVIIGVMTVIAVASIVAGMNRYVANQLAQLGPTTFFIDKWGIITSEEEWFKAMKRKDLTVADADAVREYCKSCERVGVMTQTLGRIKYGSQYVSDVEIQGATSNIEEITSVVTEFGHFPTEYDNEHRTQVALIGWVVADKLFPYTDPIGKRIYIGANSFTVIGVAEKKGSFLGQNQDNFVIMPLGTYQKLIQERQYDWFGILVKAVDYQRMEKAMDECRLILRARRHVPPQPFW
jgi:putative ABC transport system permease protein